MQGKLPHCEFLEDKPSHLIHLFLEDSPRGLLLCPTEDNKIY